MTHTKYQKYVFCHLKIGANGAGAYTIPRSVSYGIVLPLVCTVGAKITQLEYAIIAHAARHLV